jgi:ATP-dependent DNA helicase DinG
MATTDDIHSLACDSYRALAKKLPGFRERSGQEAMIHEILDGLSGVTFAADERPRPQVSVVQGGTGVGKTVGFLCPSILLAQQLKVKLLVSTATVSLQEQLINKDLPTLAAAMPNGFTYGLLKGRGRYACPVKLDRMLGAGQGDLLDGDIATEDSAPQKTIRLYRKLAGHLVKGWAGDKDTVPEPLEDADWSRIAADRHSCTGNSCESYKKCPYYQAKRHIAKVDVIVANHDLVLSSLQNDAKAIPGGDRAIYVFDEGHHLPSTAINHFAATTDITARQWIAALDKAINMASAAASLGSTAGIAHGCETLSERVADIERLCVDLYGTTLRNKPNERSAPARVRLSHGQLPRQLAEAWAEAQKVAQSLLEPISTLMDSLKELRSADPDKAPSLNNHLIALGPLLRKLNQLIETAELMLDDRDPPPAKWLNLELRRGQVFVTAHACPMVAGPLLYRHLWSRLRAAVVTSATIKTLGSFDFFLRETGLSRLDRVRCAEVQSPFDYAKQGRLVIVQTKSSPKQPEQHTAEVSELLPNDLRQVAHGALVLCSSRAQMKLVLERMPDDLLSDVLAQGSRSREELLAEHRARVKRGARSILVGLRSFGEGLDLPGNQCDWVFILKLPFMSPNDPVSEARAEWMEAKGRSSFAEMVVPATGVTLNQWTGRGIRTELDCATIVCYDPRLSSTTFGKQLLRGLPPFTKVKRVNGVEELLRMPANEVPYGEPSRAA